MNRGDNVDEEIKRKTELLKIFKQELLDMEKQHVENLKILRTTLTKEEAYSHYQRGEASKEEYENYVQNRDGIEAAVRWHPQVKANTEQMIANIKAELADVEKARRQKRNRVLVLLSPVLAVLCEKLFRWMETWGNSFDPLVYEVLFCVCMLGVVFDMLWVVNKFGSWRQK